MTGAWLALGLVAGALATRSPLLAGLGLLAAVAGVGGAVAPASTRSLRVAIVFSVGLVLGWLRFGVFPGASPSPLEARGTVQWREEASGDLIVLRDDGRLVALSLERDADVRPGETVVWRGNYRAEIRRVGSLRVTGTYQVSSLEPVTGAEALLGQVRAWVRGIVLRTIPEPSGSLALGVLVGDDRGLAGETRSVLRQAGLSHLTAVSGWNVAVVTGFTEGLLRRVRSRAWLRWGIVALAIWSYAVVTGLEPPVLRAATMATLYLVARWRGWPREPISALGWSVVVLLLVQPYLADSLAFQLSGIATAALCVSSVVLRGVSRWESVILPVLVQFAVTPLVLARFGAYSLVAPIANLLVEPVVPWLMVSALLVLSDWLVPGVGHVLGMTAWLLGRWMVSVAEWSVALPGATGVMVSPPGWLVGWLYVVVAAGVLMWIDRRTAAP